jgi:ubiquitin-activating enzyme E1
LEFVETHNGQLPELLSEENQNELYELAKRYNSGGMEIEGVIKVEEIDEKIVKKIARFARTNISPVASFWGGIVAQEIIKVTGKFTPIRQWLHSE